MAYNRIRQISFKLIPLLACNSHQITVQINLPLITSELTFTAATMNETLNQEEEASRAVTTSFEESKALSRSTLSG